MNIIIMLPKGAMKAIESSSKVRLLAWVVKSGTTNGSLVLLKKTPQINHRTVMLQFSNVHLMCRGHRMLVTLNRLRIRLPLITRFLSLKSDFSRSFLIYLKVSFMLRNSSSSVE
jgi:hypothetical protein